MTAEITWKPPERRLLLFVASVYAFIGARLYAAPSAVSGGAMFALLFLVAALAVFAHVAMPYRRHLRAAGGALATVAPASRALAILIDAGKGYGPPDALVAAAAWFLVAGLLLFTWSRITPPLRRAP